MRLKNIPPGNTIYFMKLFKRILPVLAVVSYMLPAYAWYSVTDIVNVSLYDWARLAGLLAFVTLAIQSMLGIRIRAFDVLLPLGLKYRLHRLFGILLAILVVLHPLLLGLYSINTVLGGGLFKMFGTVVFISLLMSVFVSFLLKDRLMKFSHWRVVHRVNFLMLPLAGVHSIMLGSTLAIHFPLKVFWWLLGGLHLVLFSVRIIRYFILESKAVEVLSVEKHAEDVVRVEINKVDPDVQAGQAGFFRFPSFKIDGQFHPFSMVSGPDENVSFIARMDGDFTSKLDLLKPGDPVVYDGPFGDFNVEAPLSEEVRGRLFIAGGVGITPFVHAIKNAVKNAVTEKPLVIFWINKSDENLPLNIEEIVKDSSQVRLIKIFTKKRVSGLDFGRLNAYHLQKHVPDVSAWEVFICGPAGMVKSAERDVSSLGVPAGHIHKDSFRL